MKKKTIPSVTSDFIFVHEDYTRIITYNKKVNKGILQEILEFILEVF